jgi:hypothetical protein
VKKERVLILLIHLRNPFVLKKSNKRILLGINERLMFEQRQQQKHHFQHVFTGNGKS